MNKTEKAIEILKEMFTERGYTDFTQEDSKLFAIKLNGEQICAFLNPVRKLNVSEIHNIINILQSHQINHGIIIHEGEPTPAVKNVILNTVELGMNIEIFHIDDLQFNLTKNIYVPKHVLVTQEELDDFKKKHINPKDFPVLLRSDAVSRFYDFHRGEIVRIMRKSGYVAYRIVR